jgi:hypothetical protein
MTMGKEGAKAIPSGGSHVLATQERHRAVATTCCMFQAVVLAKLPSQAQPAKQYPTR